MIYADADGAVDAAATSPTSVQACSPAQQEDQHRTPAHYTTPARDEGAAQHMLPAEHATPAQNAASPQPMSKAQHDTPAQAMQPAQQTTPTEQQSAEHAMSPGVSAPGMASAVQASGIRATPDSHHGRRMTPHFREMQVLNSHLPCLSSA